MTKQKDDLKIIERLNAASSLQGAVLTAVELFETALNKLVQRIFRKDDHAVKYAVEPLLNSSGPLGNLMVRLKLTFALGIISQEVYQDMENLVKLRDRLNRDNREFSFTSPATLEAIKKIGLVQQAISASEKDADINFDDMYMARQEQVIRSAFALAIASTCSQLDKETPLF
ncbi:MltR family transcriptional regulator [Psychromonas sp.]|uniref:MltR family transcriptional regulator n=1 Tax=Psychromonas sp. TaxID=1884585 RepID=UPI00356B2FF6